jgi:outer membrane protein
MKKTLIAICASATVLLGANAYAYTIGTVDVQQIFASSVAQKMQASLQKKFAKQNSSLVTQMKQLQAKQKKLEKNKAVMSQADYQKQDAALKGEATTAQQAQLKFQQAYMKARQAAMQTFSAEIKTAAKEVAQKDKLDAVMINQALLYVKDSQDVTSEVIAKLK